MRVKLKYFTVEESQLAGRFILKEHNVEDDFENIKVVYDDVYTGDWDILIFTLECGVPAEWHRKIEVGGYKLLTMASLEVVE